MKGVIRKIKDEYYIEYLTNDTTDDGFGLKGSVFYKLDVQSISEEIIGQEFPFLLNDNKLAIL